MNPLLTLALVLPIAGSPASPVAGASQDGSAQRGSGPGPSLETLRSAAKQEEAQWTVGPPPGTAPEAKALWDRMMQATGAAGAERPTAFDVEFGVLTREGVQTNEFRTTHRYLSPGFVRTRLESGRETGRGPAGYWFREKDEIVRLIGRDYVEDRRLVDELLAISRNFLALSSPGTLRMRDLKRSEGPLERMPLGLQERAAEVEWIAFQSPDFQLYTTGDEARTGNALPGASTPSARAHAVRLGLDPKTGLPRFALIEEVGAPGAPMLVQLERYETIDGFHIPKTVLVHELVLSPTSERFAERPARELYLITGSFRPSLAPEMFEP